LRAAELVVRLATGRRFIHPNVIHRILMRGTGRKAGRYRRCQVSVVSRKRNRPEPVYLAKVLAGKQSLSPARPPEPRILRHAPMPRPECVGPLMGKWERLCREALRTPLTRGVSARFAYAILHHEFLSIHPYEDGNGRTARLLLNAFRLQFGLPWLIIRYGYRGSYYRHIRKYQEEYFQPEHADCYPPSRA
jgi:Fic family protein